MTHGMDEMCVCDIQHNTAIIPQTENTVIGWYELAIKKLEHYRLSQVCRFPRSCIEVKLHLLNFVISHVQSRYETICCRAMQLCCVYKELTAEVLYCHGFNCTAVQWCTHNINIM